MHFNWFTLPYYSLCRCSEILFILLQSIDVVDFELNLKCIQNILCILSRFMRISASVCIDSLTSGFPPFERISSEHLWKWLSYFSSVEVFWIPSMECARNFLSWAEGISCFCSSRTAYRAQLFRKDIDAYCVPSIEHLVEASPVQGLFQYGDAHYNRKSTK